MSSAVTSRAEATDLVATALLHRASRFTRLVMRQGPRELTRTEAGLLGTLADGPRRITELADSEALAQPSVTQLVDRLERRGLLARARSPHDGRVVLVSISPDGLARLQVTRAANRILVRDAVEGLDDEEVIALAGATETLGRLIETLQCKAEG
ncbi:MAG: MarR family winged helix-turn-helix transcriptional regulator [Janthinobacterium lividum]